MFVESYRDPAPPPEPPQPPEPNASWTDVGIMWSMLIAVTLYVIL